MKESEIEALTNALEKAKGLLNRTKKTRSLKVELEKKLQTHGKFTLQVSGLSQTWTLYKGSPETALIFRALEVEESMSSIALNQISLRDLLEEESEGEVLGNVDGEQDT